MYLIELNSDALFAIASMILRPVDALSWTCTCKTLFQGGLARLLEEVRLSSAQHVSAFSGFIERCSQARPDLKFLVLDGGSTEWTTYSHGWLALHQLARDTCNLASKIIASSPGLAGLQVAYVYEAFMRSPQLSVAIASHTNLRRLDLTGCRRDVKELLLSLQSPLQELRLTLYDHINPLMLLVNFTSTLKVIFLEVHSRRPLTWDNSQGTQWPLVNTITLPINASILLSPFESAFPNLRNLLLGHDHIDSSMAFCARANKSYKCRVWNGLKKLKGSLAAMESIACAGLEVDTMQVESIIRDRRSAAGLKVVVEKLQPTMMSVQIAFTKLPVIPGVCPRLVALDLNISGKREAELMGFLVCGSLPPL